MNFDLTEEQQMLQDMARKFAENEMLPTLKEYESEHKVNFGLIKKNGLTRASWNSYPPGIWRLGV